MRMRWRVALGAALALMISAVGGAAAATAPVALEPGFVTDSAGVLDSADHEAAEQRLTALAENGDAELFVVFVDEFTDPSDRIEWADDVAANNGLGVDQYLLAIAVDGRELYISADQNGPLSEATLNRIEDDITTPLRAQDWLGAIEVAADGMTSSSGTGGLPVFIGLAVAVAVILLIVWLVRRQKSATSTQAPPVPDPNDPYAGVSDEELAKQADSALVQTDDAITSSREELGFAIAQFGEDSTAVFSTTVDQAAAKLTAAFSLKQKLDDAEPDTDEQRRQWHIDIIALCDQAADLLEDNVEAFEELRQLEKEAPQALERVKAARATAQQPVDAAPAALASLAAVYAPDALSTVADNPVQAVDRLALADNEILEAEQLLAEGKRGEAAFSIRTAEEASGQAVQLAQAITAQGAALEQADQQVQTLIADLEADLAAAAQLHDADGRVAAAATATRSAIDSARSQQGGPRDPQHMLETLDAANTRIDEVIANVRDAAARVERARRLLEQRLGQAQSQINTAAEFISTRRGAVGSRARTRLSEANDALQRALTLQATDTEASLAQATRAEQFAREAISSATSDVSGWSGAGGWGGATWGGSYDRNNYNAGGGLGSDIIGGIIGGLLAGGGGGSSRGGGWRSGGGSSSRGYRPSGFGGGSRGSRSFRSSSSRSSGSRSSGGRGRSGGRRF